jgi:hypothetical protein
MKQPIQTLVAGTLSQTIDNVHHAFFEGRALSRRQREEAGRWIAARQGLPHAYASTFALSAAERKAGIQVFTGERMTSASARHIAGEEACVALLELDEDDRAQAGPQARGGWLCRAPPRGVCARARAAVATRRDPPAQAWRRTYARTPNATSNAASNGTTSTSINASV